jgi:hypothetical protein
MELLYGAQISVSGCKEDMQSLVLDQMFLLKLDDKQAKLDYSMSNNAEHASSS